MKKLFATLLALCMVLGMATVTALASESEDPVETPVEQVETVAESDDVIDTEAKLKAALEAGGEVVLGGNIKVTAEIQIPAGMTATLDLAGYAITSGYQTNSTTKHIYPLNNYGTLTIKDSVGTGSITGRGIYNQDGATITVNGAKIVAEDWNGGAGIWSYGTGKVYLNNAAIIGNTGVVSSEGYLEINGGTYTCYSGITDDGTQATAPTYNIRAYNGLKITDGTFTSRHGVISFSGGEGVIEKGSYTIEFAAATTSNVVYVYGNADLTIKDGSFISDNTSGKADSGAAVLVSDSDAKLTIEKGTYVGMNGMVSINDNTVINGGSFDTVWDYNHYDSIESAVAEDAVVTVGGTVYTKTEDGLEETVAKIGNTIYASLADAIAAANDQTGTDAVTINIYGKAEYTAQTEDLVGAYDAIHFVGMTDNAEISITRNGSNGYISGSNQSNDCAVTFTNLILSKPEGYYANDAGDMNICFTVYRVDSVSYTDCTFPNGACAAGCPTTYTRCTFQKSHDKYALWAYGSPDIQVDACDFDDDRGIKMYAEGAAKTTVLTVKNSDFSKLTGKPAIVLTYGSSVTLSGNTYSSTGVFELDQDGAPNGTSVTADIADIACKNDNYNDCGVLVDGKIYVTITDAAAVATSSSMVTLMYDPTETVELPMGVTLNKNGYTAENVTVPVPVAQVGEDQYASLAEALANVGEGETITLLAETYEEGSIKLPATMKNVIIKNATGITPVLKNMTINSSDGSTVSYDGITFDGIVFDNSNIVLTGQRTGEVVYKNWTITNCEFKNIIRDGNYAAFHLNANSAADDDESMDGFTFTNNVINGVSGSSNSGIVVNAAKGTIEITNNVIKNVAWNAIQLMNVPDTATVTISGNILAATAKEGIANLNKVKAAPVITENQFLVTENQPGICYITSADVSGNYWGGTAPANLPEGVTYTSYYTTATNGTLGGLMKKLTFDANGGKFAENGDTEITDFFDELPQRPGKENYTFTGWFTAAEGGTQVTELSAVSAGSTLYAQWTINQYTITFKAGYGDNATITEITQDYGTAIEAPANPTRGGYWYFNGWDQAIPATMPAENVTITAQWYYDEPYYEPVTPPTTTEKTENEDGSTTTTVTNNKTGTVTETTENVDGSTTTVETQKDGTVTEIVENTDGSSTTTETKSETTTNKDGSTTTTTATKTESTDSTGATVTETKTEEKVETATGSVTTTTTEVKSEDKTEVTETKAETVVKEDGTTETMTESTTTATDAAGNVTTSTTTATDAAGNVTTSTTTATETTTAKEDGTTETVKVEETVAETTEATTTTKTTATTTATAEKTETVAVKEETVTKTDGTTETKTTTTTETALADGTTGTATTDETGKTEATVTVSEQAAAAAAETGTAVALPIPAVTTTTESETAATVSVTTNSTENTKVEIPVADVTSSTVAVLVDADGNETVITTTQTTENGIVVEVPDGATVKIVDNSTNFADVEDHDWEKDAVDFASARGLVNGVGNDSFDLDGITTRAHVVTLLARLSGVDTTPDEGETWYDKGEEWAVANGITYGGNMNAEVSRHSMFTMLWLLAGAPDSDHDISHFNDIDGLTQYTETAARWAVEIGLVGGHGNGTMDPTGTVTRGQLAQFMKNFIQLTY